jgi:hypothetical protein
MNPAKQVIAAIPTILWSIRGCKIFFSCFAGGAIIAGGCGGDVIMVGGVGFGGDVSPKTAGGGGGEVRIAGAVGFGGD